MKIATLVVPIFAAFSACQSSSQNTIAASWMCDVKTDDDHALLNIQLVEPSEFGVGAGYVALLPPQSGEPTDWGGEAEFQMNGNRLSFSGNADSKSFSGTLNMNVGRQNEDHVIVVDPFDTRWLGSCERHDSH